jgi:hypothetical protein
MTSLWPHSKLPNFFLLQVFVMSSQRRSTKSSDEEDEENVPLINNSVKDGDNQQTKKNGQNSPKKNRWFRFQLAKSRLPTKNDILIALALLKALFMG